MSINGLAEETQFTFCQDEEETALLVLCECEALARLRHRSSGIKKPEATSYLKGPISRLWNLIKEIKLDKKL